LTISLFDLHYFLVETFTHSF